MASFPSSFEDSTHKVPGDKLGTLGVEAAQKLADQGYEVHHGLTTDMADAIIAMALEPGIREYCPNDCGRRFANKESTSEWLAKERGTFLLLKRNDQNELSLAGYGWVGAETNSKVPGGETTFAIRIGEQHQGKGLASPFARLIVSGASAVYGAQNMWLETWASNGGAVHTYHKIGFTDVAEEPGERKKADGSSEADTRLYMSLNNELLNN